MNIINWHHILTDEDATAFMRVFGEFHDSCIKEIKYVSGSFVSANLSMNPLNSKRELRVIFQRQYSNPTTIEIVFEQLYALYLCPASEEYTSEIISAYFHVVKGKVIWADSDCFNAESPNLGTISWIIAAKAKWRKADEYVSDKELY